LEDLDDPASFFSLCPLGRGCIQGGARREGKSGWCGKWLFCIVLLLGWALVSMQSEPAMGARYVLPDTGQTTCYNDTFYISPPIPCPEPGQSFYGQDGNYQGPQAAYRDNGDGTVTDLNTGLMWQQDDSHNSSGYSWKGAVSYCRRLTLGNHKDWRLPSVRELSSLVTLGGRSSADPAIDTTYFPGCVSNYYWSSTPYVHAAHYSWGVYFDFGLVGYGDRSYPYNVRCVRGASSF
jgi:hypothetical protein